jgi:cyclophilin family peptidyl-prolyl cis-trans isomerase
VKIAGREDHPPESFFVVELASRKQLPHTSFTFISLVESTFYDGTCFDSEQRGTLYVGSSPQHCQGLEQKLDPLGFTDGSALSFLEESPEFPCGPYSLGFVDRGPGLHLSLQKEVRNDGRPEQNCFGRVVRGMELLSTVQSSLRDNGKPVEILKVERLALINEA